MKLGVHLVNFSLPGGPETIGPTLAATGRAAEEAGLDNLSFMDHYLQLEFLSTAEDPMLEGYTALGFLAAHTTSVELQVRRLLLIGHLDEAERALAVLDPAPFPPAWRAAYELVVAGIAIRRLRTDAAHVALGRAERAARRGKVGGCGRF